MLVGLPVSQEHCTALGGQNLVYGKKAWHIKKYHTKEESATS